MQQVTVGTAVETPEGRKGVVEAVAQGRAQIRFNSGEAVTVPISAIVHRELTSTTTPSASRDQMTGASAGPTATGNISEETVVPVVEETLHIGKRVRETGSVAVHVVPHERQEVVDVPLVDEHVDVERVEVNRLVDAPPPIREEGDVTVVPVMEEVLVVEKRLRVKYELRLTRRRETRRDVRTVTLRGEEARVLRSDLPPA